jgi:uncharacterized repeat protein (TIGR03803 family)
MKTSIRSLALLVSALLFICGMASSQGTETVLYSFGASATDGLYPYGSLLFDAAGNIYGVTSIGGTYCLDLGGCGTIYKLSPSKSGQWTERVLYNFCSTGNSSTCPDGSNPSAGLIMDANGNLYGTTGGGGTEGAGVVFRLTPPSVLGEVWTQTVLWTFSSSPQNGFHPGTGTLAMDGAGNIYGTTVDGGADGIGVVYELRPQIDGTYSFSLLHSFSGSDGALPGYGVTLDGAGNLYGATGNGGRGKSICNHGCGLVYKLGQSGGSWEETVLFEFDGIVGANPETPISIDKFGNLYGSFTTGGGGNCFSVGCGGIFKLVPGTAHKYVFYFNNNGGGTPESGVALGTGNTLYGTTGVVAGGDVYMLQDSQETILYNFCSLPNCVDGSWPSYGDIVLRGNALYGTTIQGGSFNGGVIYQIRK